MKGTIGITIPYYSEYPSPVLKNRLIVKILVGTEDILNNMIEDILIYYGRRNSNYNPFYLCSHDNFDGSSYDKGVRKSCNFQIRKI